MKTFVSDTEIGFCHELGVFCQQYPNYKDILNIDTTVISDINKANAVVQMIVVQQSKIQMAAAGFTAFKNLLLNGNGADVISTYPLMPVYPAIMPTICLANVVSQFRDVIQRCVATKKLTEEMGIAMGFVKLLNLTDLSAGTPDLSVKTINGGHPDIHCTIGDYDDFEIWKNTGTGFVLLSISSKPHYTDKTPLPAIGVSAIWIYKTIYRYKNEQIGNWSETVTIAVYGTI